MTKSRSAVVALVLLVLTGCAVTRQARSVEKSGFLGDYSQLKPGPDGGALLVYKNPASDIKRYDKVLLDPVAIWTKSGSELSELSKEDRTRIVNHLYTLLQMRLAKDYKLVTTPEPGTLRIAVAITDADSSNPTLDTVSTLLPVGLAVSTLKAVATGKPASVGDASAEMKVTDATSDDVIYAAVDRRFGTKNPTGLFNRWEDVDSAMAYWADRAAFRLCTDRGDANCVAP